MMGKKKKENLVVTTYIDRPPEYEAVEVTRDNIDEIATWMRCTEVTIRRSGGGVIWEVTFHHVYAQNDRGEELDDLTFEFPNPPDAKVYRRWFALRDSKGIVRKITPGNLEHKYIQIPQEESIIS